MYFDFVLISGRSAQKKGANMPNINLNNCKVDDLTRISGFSKERAEALIRYRDEHGPFKGWGDVDKVPGFSQNLIDLLKRSGVNFGEKKRAA